MGLDMYLTGKKFLSRDWRDPSKDRMEDGFRIENIDLALGYWRKHPNLHGYIVQNFANGVDECQSIELEIPQMEQIIAAIKADQLPHTEGFFFGRSATPKDGAEFDEEKRESIEIFERAIAWLRQYLTPDGKYQGNVWPSVEYRASW